jgi:N-carbamoyl-L-amino-acid hydrolase
VSKPLGFRPERVIADLRELAALTGGPDGARRVAWTTEWLHAREWLTGKLEQLPCTVKRDPAGNLLADLPGDAPGFLAVGSHLDSVPNGGWLDGALGVLAGLELLRGYAEGAAPPAGLRLIDWADEEGARFGRSLFGSSAATGVLDLRDASTWTDASGTTLAEAMAACGLDLADADGATASLNGIVGYLELHIEQGPVLERTGHQLAVVSGTAGVQRKLLRLFGESLHAGAAPMDMRHDPVVLAAAIITAVAQRARAANATATFGALSVSPGVVTIVPERCDVVIDIRHPEPAALDRLVAENEADVARRAAGAGVRAEWKTQWAIEPIPFHPELIELARASCEETGVEPLLMPSGALHDAAAVARTLPVVMLFTPSRRGVSHSPGEDTAEADLVAALRAFAVLAHRALEWAADRV